MAFRTHHHPLLPVHPYSTLARNRGDRLRLCATTRRVAAAPTDATVVVSEANTRPALTLVRAAPTRRPGRPLSLWRLGPFRRSHLALGHTRTHDPGHSSSERYLLPDLLGHECKSRVRRPRQILVVTTGTYAGSRGPNPAAYAPPVPVAPWSAWKRPIRPRANEHARPRT